MIRSGLFLLFSLIPTAYLSAQAEDEIRMSIFFGGGSYTIDREQQDNLIRWLDSIPNLDRYQVFLISRTDPIGGIEYNAWLSRMRSHAVYSLLVQQLVPREKISVKDWGLENPLFDNDSMHGRMSNRRVDVILYPTVF